MAPVRRTKKPAASPAASDSSGENHVASPAAPATLSPTKAAAPPRSPLRRVAGAISRVQKQVLLDNLRLEISERARRLRAQAAMQARTLRQRIEMRINRVPKKLWKMKMSELLAEASGNSLTQSMTAGGARRFVEDVRRISSSEGNVKEDRLVVPKKRSPAAQKPATGAAAPLPPAALGPSSSKTNLPPSIASSSPLPVLSPTKSSPPQRQPQPQSPIKGQLTKAKKLTRPISAASTRTDSRMTTRSSLETASTGVSDSTRGTKSSQAKAAAAAAVKQKNVVADGGIKRGNVKGVGSSGSLKENKVDGVKKEAKEEKAKKPLGRSGAKRVLRTRK